jgi:uncharacterized protein (DUF433 family)
MVGMNANTLKRWLLGYDHDGKQEAELKPQYVAGDDGLLLGFRDLVEARIVYALRQKGIGLQTIRICIERARTIVEDDRPFSTSQFKTDGKNIFLEIAKELAEPELIDLEEAPRCVPACRRAKPSGAGLWRKRGRALVVVARQKTAVADPHRAFGQPIIAETGMTTARAAQIVKAEGSIERAAKVYEMPVRLLRDALAYQQHLGVRKAA